MDTVTKQEILDSMVKKKFEGRPEHPLTCCRFGEDFGKYDHCMKCVVKRSCYTKKKESKR